MGPVSQCLRVSVSQWSQWSQLSQCLSGLSGLSCLVSVSQCLSIGLGKSLKKTLNLSLISDLCCSAHALGIPPSRWLPTIVICSSPLDLAFGYTFLRILTQIQSRRA